MHLASLYQKEGKRYMGAQDSANGRVRVAIIGSGNIGSDLMYKLLKQPGHMELVLLTGIDPASDGLARARSLGIRASHEGIKAVLEDPDIKIVFDATSARAHVRHAKALREAGRIAVDLTPAARGPYVVPPANLKAHLDEINVNMVTCGGPAATPIVSSPHPPPPLPRAHSSRTLGRLSAAPGDPHDNDEISETTARSP